MAAIDNLMHELGASWMGPAETEFLHSWQRTLRPGMLQAQEAVLGLAQSGINNVVQQVQASDVPGGGAPGSSSATSTWQTVKAAGSNSAAEAENWSKKYGWLAAPVVGLNRYVLGAQYGDQGFRAVQDLQRGDTQDPIDMASNDGAGILMSKGGVVGIGGGVDVILWQNVYDYGHAINWDYTIHNLGLLNPLAPGAMQAVWQGETQGFEHIGTEIFETGAGAAIGAIF
jgi:hypothetical protein